MTQAYETPVFEIEIEQIVLEELPVEQKKILFIKKKSDEIDKKRMIKRWKMTEGYFYLHPEKFRFSNRDL